MGKLLVISSIIACISLSAPAQKLDASKVPAVVKASFAKYYPGVAPKWEKENGRYEVNFKQNGKTMSVLMDDKGAICETEVEIKVTELPATLLAYVKEHYKGKTIKEGAKITRADGKVNYEAEVNGLDVIFDENGKILKNSKH